MRPRIRRAVGAVAASAALAAGGLTLAAGAASAATAGPAAAGYVPPKHDLFYGNKGAAVRSVQRRLAQLHYYPGPIDGKYGADLQQAVWAFKEVQGLPLNRWSNSVVTYAFRKALVHPKAPRVLIKHGRASRIEINLHIQVLVLYKKSKPGPDPAHFQRRQLPGRAGLRLDHARRQLHGAVVRPRLGARSAG